MIDISSRFLKYMEHNMVARLVLEQATSEHANIRDYLEMLKKSNLSIGSMRNQFLAEDTSFTRKAWPCPAYVWTNDRQFSHDCCSRMSYQRVEAVYEQVQRLSRHRLSEIEASQC